MLKKRMLVVCLGLSLSLSLVGCDTITKQDIGTLGGGAIGGLLGSQFGGGNGRILAVMGGTLLGAFIGNQIGKSMDQTDQLMMERSLNTGQGMRWTNNNTGASYEVIPGASTSSNCRDYTMYAFIDGKKRPVHGQACKQGGRWVVAQN